MLAQLKHVALTYLTWKWIWFVIAIVTLCTFSGFASQGGVVVALGMPCIFGPIFLSAVVKWQFANPRARLLPEYTAPHLGLFGGILLVLFVINPLALATIHNMNAWGLLSLSLLLVGCALMAILLGRGIYIVPALAIFYSILSEPTHHFWFDDASQYTAMHVLLVLIGSGMIGYCFWLLAHLTEEMDEYQVLPIGNLQGSRLERAEQRKLLGSQIKKQKLLGWFSDRWLDRGLAQSEQHNLIEFGLARTSAPFAALVAGVAFTLYLLVLHQFFPSRPATNGRPPTMLFAFALILPTGVFGMTLMQHRPRMAAELLRPATRGDYLDRMIRAIVKRSALLWVGTHVGLAVIVAVAYTFPPAKIVAMYLLLSIALSVSAFGLCLRMALWNSMFGYLMGMYAVVGIQIGSIALWWQYHETNGWTVALLLATVHLFAGTGFIRWARRKWLAAELG